MKKIVIVASSLQAGGAERVISILSSAWINNGYEVTILTTFLDESENDFYNISNKVTRIRLIEHCKTRTRSFLGYFNRMLIFRGIIQRENADIVISFVDRINIMTLIGLFGTNNSVAVCERIDPFEHPIGKLMGWLRPIMYRKASVVFAQTDYVAKRMKSHWKLEHVEVIANPLPNDLPQPIDWIFRENVILSVGRLDRQKGHDLLLNAWASIQTNFPEWKLRILGEGEERSNLESQMLKLGLEGRVEIPGLVSPIWQEYQKAKIFVLASRYEGFPNALLEALAMGCACLSTKCPSGPEEIICDDENGMLVAIDYTSIADSLQSLIENNGAQRKYALRYKYAKEKYSIELIASEWERKLGLYKS